jgi:CRISPR-associated protein Csm2
MSERKVMIPITGGAGSPGGPPGGEGGVSEHVKWIKSKSQLSALGNEDLVTHADQLGLLLKDGLNTTQIRKLLSRITALTLRFDQQFDQEEVPLLKVRLAYAAARERRGVGTLAEVLLPAVDLIKSEADYRWFSRFVEAIVAYHRYHGGRD